MRKRHAMKRPAELTPGKRRIRVLSGCERFARINADKSVQSRLPMLDAREERLRQLHGRKHPVTDRRCGLRQRKKGRIGHRLISRCWTAMKLDGSISRGIVSLAAVSRLTAGPIAAATRLADCGSMGIRAAPAMVKMRSAETSGMRTLL
jgi:hypothetical protein